MSRAALALGFLLVLVASGMAYSVAVGLVANGQPVAADVPPQIAGGTVYLPLRVTAEALGLTVEWIPKSRTVALCIGGRCRPVRLDDPQTGARIINGRIMLPLRKAAELLGCEVAWDEKLFAIRVTSPKKAPGQR